MQFFVPVPWPLALFFGFFLLLARIIIAAGRVLIHATAVVVGFAIGYARTTIALRRAQRPHPPAPVDNGGMVIDGEARRVDE